MEHTTLWEVYNVNHPTWVVLVEATCFFPAFTARRNPTSTLKQKEQTKAALQQPVFTEANHLNWFDQ